PSASSTAAAVSSHEVSMPSTGPPISWPTPIARLSFAAAPSYDTSMSAAHPSARVAPHHRALPLRVGPRGSPLALWQTRFFLARLTPFCPVLRGPLFDDRPVFEEHPIRTTGDATQEAGT